MAVKTRLKKLADEGGMGTGYSAVPILFGNPEEIVDNKDELTNKTYGPSISKEWLFEQPTDYAEWQLRSSNKIKNIEK